jgi:hypothetical protein
MKRHLSFVVLIAFIAASSCNYPETPATETIPTQPIHDIPATGGSSPTAMPSETLIVDVVLPTATYTSTPSITLASPREQPVNCRVGPDISYAVIGALNLGTQAEVIGKNIDITWLYVRNPSDPSTNCWLSVDFINVRGNVELLPVVGLPEIMVTNVEVTVEPVAMNVACNAFPQNVVISAEITTNGPSVVAWYWESSEGKVSQQKQVLFEAGGTKIVQDYYQVDRAGNYSIQVKTALPNITMGDATFKAICTP